MRELVPPREIEGFSATSEHMIGCKLGYPDRQAWVDAALSGEDSRPQQLQTMMAGGYVWRVIEEERAPDLDQFQAGILSGVVEDSAEFGRETGMPSSSAATQLTLAVEVRAEIDGGERFLSESVASGYRVMAEPLEREAGQTLDSDGLYSWAFNFGYALRTLEPFVAIRTLGSRTSGVMPNAAEQLRPRRGFRERLRFHGAFTGAFGARVKRRSLG
jgi:hypothetical protein